MRIARLSNAAHHISFSFLAGPNVDHTPCDVFENPLLDIAGLLERHGLGQLWIVRPGL